MHHPKGPLDQSVSIPKGHTKDHYSGGDISPILPEWRDTHTWTSIMPPRRTTHHMTPGDTLKLTQQDEEDTWIGATWDKSYCIVLTCAV